MTKKTITDYYAKMMKDQYPSIDVSDSYIVTKLFESHSQAELEDIVKKIEDLQKKSAHFILHFIRITERAILELPEYKDKNPRDFYAGFTEGKLMYDGLKEAILNYLASKKPAEGEEDEEILEPENK